MKCVCGHSAERHFQSATWCSVIGCACVEMRPPARQEHLYTCENDACPPRATIIAAVAPRCYTCGEKMTYPTDLSSEVATPWWCICGYRYTRRSAGPPTCYVCGEKMLLTITVSA